MKLTPFGKAVRFGRVEIGRTLKDMANHLNISSPLLSSIEFGERRLTDAHLDKALEFFTIHQANSELIETIRKAGFESMTVVETTSLGATERGLVAAFARRLVEDGAPPPQFNEWLNKKD